MQIRGTVVSFEDNVQIPKNGGGTYQGSRLSYRDEAGALKEKAFHSNVFKFNAGLKVQLSNLKSNARFIAEAEKEGEFWNWKSVAADTTPESSGGNTTNGSTKAIVSPKSTYETPEERAKKQGYINRLATIAHALTFLKDKKNTSVGEVVEIAKQFEAHVLGEDFDDGSAASIIDDSDEVV